MSQVEFTVGCTWDSNQPYEIAAFNEQFSTQRVAVTELYGSLRAQRTGVPSARPDFRLPDIGILEFKRFVKLARSLSISVNYTCNATLHCSVETLYSQRRKIRAFFKGLEEIGIARLTLCNPLLVEIACASCSLPVEISTVLHPSFISQIPIYAAWRADRICLDIYRNRDIHFLREYSRVANRLNVAPVLIVNEFCMFGNTPCLGTLRQACYEHSSLGGNERKRFSNWPFDRCHTRRMRHPHSWLQARFILPQHTDTYVRLTGIRHFKITGRTFSWPYLSKLVKHYLSKTFDEPLPALWVDPGNPSTSDIVSRFDITPRELRDARFFERWFEEGLACDYSCDIRCSYCAKKYTEIMTMRKAAE